jgi:hypothetical protein
MRIRYHLPPGCELWAKKALYDFLVLGPLAVVVLIPVAHTIPESQFSNSALCYILYIGIIMVTQCFFFMN